MINTSRGLINTSRKLITLGVADTTVPELLSATIDSTGEVLILRFNDVVICPTGVVAGLNLDIVDGDQNVACTYVEGNGTLEIRLTPAVTIGIGDALDLDYTQPGGGIRDRFDNDLATISNQPVTNTSTADSTPPATPVVEIVMMTYNGINAEVLIYENGGTVYWMLTSTDIEPSAEDIISGTHVYYVSNGSINDPVAGTQPVSDYSLSPETNYWLWAVHQDAALNVSEVAYDTDITPPAP